jgi:tetratricopeptide (TPR) repeat protein
MPLKHLQIFSLLLISVAGPVAAGAQTITGLSLRSPDLQGTGTASVEFRGIPVPPEAANLPEIQALLNRDDWPAAERQCREILSTNSSSADAHYLLGYTLYREGKAVDSLHAYTAAAALRRPQAADLMAVAADYVLLLDYNDADIWFTKATEWNPGDVLGWYYRGRAEYKREKYADALAAFQKALSLDPKNPRIADNLGLTFEMLGDTEKAKDAFLSAIQMETSNPSGYSLPYLNLGMLLISNNDLHGGLPLLERAVAMSPANPKAHEELARAYQQKGDYAASESELHAALAEAPDVPSLHFLLGRVYEKEGMSKKAEEEFQRTAALYAKQASSEVPDRVAPSSK